MDPENIKMGIAALTGGALVAFSALFFPIHNKVLEVEGGYVNDPNDLGGETNYGVTEEVAREYGFTGEMEDLDSTASYDIGWDRYWTPLHLTSIAIAEDTAFVKVAGYLYSISYNMGPGRAGAILQRCLNALNNEGRLYSDVRQDGIIGWATLEAFNAYVAHRKKAGMNPLAVCVQGLQVHHYIWISEKRPSNEEYTYGWIRRVYEDRWVNDFPEFYRPSKETTHERDSLGTQSRDSTEANESREEAAETGR